MACEAWPIVWPCDIATTDPDLVAAAQTSAQNILWALSGRRLGICDYREAYYPPCSSECGGPYKDAQGHWRNGIGSGACCGILLLHRPVVEVLSVTEFGVPLYPVNDYRWSSSYLLRVGGCWPYSAACGEPPVEVAYRAGITPTGAGLAVGEVACEYLRALQGEACRLPSRATQIARQGVTVTMDRAEDFTERGRLGLPVADAWLDVVNPKGLDRPSRAYSPDLPRAESMAGSSTASSPVRFAWKEADPVAKVVVAHDGVARGWLGDYQAQIRSGPDASAPLVGAFTVTATAQGYDVRFDFTLDETASTAIPAGDYWWDAQQEGGPTRLSGTATVSAQITVMA